MTVASGWIRPTFSACSIIDTPIRPLTLDRGLRNSSLPTISPGRPLPKRLRRTSGVPPISSQRLSAICSFVIGVVRVCRLSSPELWVSSTLGDIVDQECNSKHDDRSRACRYECI